MALYTTHKGESLHDALGDEIRRARARMLRRATEPERARRSGVFIDGVERGRGLENPFFVMRFLPGTVFTDGEFMYEVVYGCQGLGPRPTGWVAAARTDYLDDPDSAPERYCYSLFGWSGKARDGVIIGGGAGRRPFILQLVKAAPRLAR